MSVRERNYIQAQLKNKIQEVRNMQDIEFENSVFTMAETEKLSDLFTDLMDLYGSKLSASKYNNDPVF
jgi:hypothetical protein